MHKLEQKTVSHLTTIRVGGMADAIFFPETPEELVTLIFELQDQGVPWAVLGGGSNTLISSKGVRGALISTSSLDWVTKTSRETVVVGAGTRLPKLAGQVAQMGLSGCEFYEGIPGTVGGALIMNAGAHGQWTSHILEKVYVLDTKTMDILTWVPGQIEFAYRYSGIDPKRYIVIEAKFRLRDGTSTQILHTMREYRQQRAQKQPKGFSSGCIFRNPKTSSPAGKIIDEMGFKGIRTSDAEVSPIHANFIINFSGKADSTQICDLIRKIQTQVWQAKKIWLQPEVQNLGDYDEIDNIIWMHPETRPEGWEKLIRLA